MLEHTIFLFVLFSGDVVTSKTVDNNFCLLGFSREDFILSEVVFALFEWNQCSSITNELVTKIFGQIKTCPAIADYFQKAAQSKISEQKESSASETYSLVEANSGSVLPDYAVDKIVTLPPLLAIAAIKEIRVFLQRLLPSPLYTFLRDDWRSREETDLNMIMLRLFLLMSVMQQTEVSLEDLLPFLERSHLGRTMVKIPIKGYAVKRLSEQLDQKQFELLMAERRDDSWAYLGTGNKGPDGWIVLEKAEEPGKSVYIFIQSKSKSKEIDQAPSISMENIQEEREKAFKVPRRLGTSTQLYISDAKRNYFDDVVHTNSGESVVIGLEQHDEYYSCLAFLKTALLKDRAIGKHA